MIQFKEKQPCRPVRVGSFQLQAEQVQSVAFEIIKLELEDAKEPIGAARGYSQPFRFPNYIWKIFKQKLQGLEQEFPGITEIISRSGLSWTEWTGEIQLIFGA